MSSSVGSARPSQGGREHRDRGRIVILELQVRELNTSLSEHLSIIRQQTEAISRLTQRLAAIEEALSQSLSPAQGPKHGKHRKHH